MLLSHHTCHHNDVSSKAVIDIDFVAAVSWQLGSGLPFGKSIFRLITCAFHKGKEGCGATGLWLCESAIGATGILQISSRFRQLTVPMLLISSAPFLVFPLSSRRIVCLESVFFPSGVCDAKQWRYAAAHHECPCQDGVYACSCPSQYDTSHYSRLLS